MARRRVAQKRKIIPDPKLSIKNGGLAPHGNQKSNWIFKQLEIIAQRFDFKLTDPIKDIPKEAIDMILYGGKEKFTVDSKTLGVSRNYKIDFHASFKVFYHFKMRLTLLQKVMLKL